MALQYRPDLPLILKDLSFTINPGEKIGIVGRTGAGKSSITQALLRSVELTKGNIVVDELDLADLGLFAVSVLGRNQLNDTDPQQLWLYLTGAFPI